MLVLPEARAGNSGPTISESFAEEEAELSIEPAFSPDAEATVFKAYDELRDTIVEKSGIDYLLMYSLFWQRGSQNGRENDLFTGQFDALVRWTLFDHETFGSGSINLHYFNLHDITNTTNANFANVLGSSWTTTDSDRANSLRAAYWRQQLWDQRLTIDVGWIDAWRAFNNNKYAGDDRSAFAALPASSNPTRHLVFGALGATVEVKATDFLTLKVGFNDANFNSFPNGDGISKGQFQVQGEMTFHLKPEGLGKGDWRLYGYHVDKTAKTKSGQGLAISIDPDLNKIPKYRANFWTFCLLQWRLADFYDKKLSSRSLGTKCC